MSIHVTILTIDGPLAYIFGELITLPTEHGTGKIIFFSQNNGIAPVQIIFISETGEEKILKNYIPIYKVLDIGVMEIQTKNDSSTYSIIGGYVSVKENQIIIFASECESAVDIDPEEAKMNFEISKANFKKDKGEETNFAFKHANARLQVVKISEAEIRSANPLDFNA